jgi:hypothetical protein
MAACTMARCTHATGTTMDGSVEGDVPHTHEKRGSEDEIRWNVTDGYGECGSVFKGARQSDCSSDSELGFHCPSRIHMGSPRTGIPIRTPALTAFMRTTVKN